MKIICLALICWLCSLQNVDAFNDTMNTIIFSQQPPKQSASIPGCPASSQPTNLIPNPNAFTQSGWNETGLALTSAAIADPCGSGTDGWQFLDTAVNTYHQISPDAVAGTSGVAYTVAALVKESTGVYVNLGNSAGSETIWGTFDTATGQFTQTSSSGGASTPTTSVQSAGNGWYYIKVTGTMTGTSYFPVVGIVESGTPGSLQPEFLGTGIGVYVYYARMSLGSE